MPFSLAPPSLPLRIHGIALPYPSSHSMPSNLEHPFPDPTVSPDMNAVYLPSPSRDTTASPSTGSNLNNLMPAYHTNNPWTPHNHGYGYAHTHANFPQFVGHPPPAGPHIRFYLITASGIVNLSFTTLLPPMGYRQEAWILSLRSSLLLMLITPYSNSSWVSSSVSWEC